MVRRIVPTLLALLLVTGAAACGGGGDDTESSDGSTDTSEDAPSSDDEATNGSPPAPAEGESNVATELGVDRDFTGEGSEEFCAEMKDAQATSTPDMNQSEFADRMAAITPPAEIATEWETMHTVLKDVADDPSGEALAAMSQEEVDAWGMANNVVAAYLADVCELAG